MFFNPINEIQAALADALKKSTGSLQTYWQTTGIRCQRWAYNEIVTRLSARGFLPAQIASIDRGADLELDLTIFRALMLQGASDKYDLETIKSFDRREELSEMVVVISGAIQDPQGTAGQVGVGDLDTSNDAFVLKPSDDGEDTFPGPLGGRGNTTVF